MMPEENKANSLRNLKNVLQQADAGTNIQSPAQIFTDKVIPADKIQETLKELSERPTEFFAKQEIISLLEKLLSSACKNTPQEASSREVPNKISNKILHSEEINKLADLIKEHQSRKS